MLEQCKARQARPTTHLRLDSKFCSRVLLQKTIFSLTPNGAAEMPTPVQRDQFTISPKGITHTPTGATYTPHPGAPHAGIMDQGQLGNGLPHGDDYRPHEVQTMIELLWAEYVDANPRLFEVHD